MSEKEHNRYWHALCSFFVLNCINKMLKEGKQQLMDEIKNELYNKREKYPPSGEDKMQKMRRNYNE